MSKSVVKGLKIVVSLIEAKNPYYLVRVYDAGKQVLTIKRIFKSEYVKRWFFYNQSLLEYNHVVVKEKKGGRTITVVFDETVSRYAKLFLFYLSSVANLKSYKRVDCLAKCWSRIDAVSPVIDVFHELSRIVEQKRFFNLLRGYCLCR